MRFLLSTLFILFSQLGFTQMRVNLTDSLGRKQGLWIQRVDSVRNFFVDTIGVSYISLPKESREYSHVCSKFSGYKELYYIAHFTYVDDVLNGLYEVYVNDTILNHKGLFVNGKPNGVFYSFYLCTTGKDAYPSVRLYKDGVGEGFFRHFGLNGELLFDTNFKGGLKEGYEFSAGGVFFGIKFYHKGKVIDGWYDLFSVKDGTKGISYKYKNGEKVKTRYYGIEKKYSRLY